MSTRPHHLRPLCVVLGLLLVAACAPGSAPEDEAADEGGAGGAEVPEFLSIATGGTGGAYYPIGGAMGNMLADEIEGVSNATAETTGGSVENIRLIHQGRAEMALAQGDAVYLGCRGEGDFDEPQNIATVALPYVNVLQVVTTEGTGIESFEDLAGKRVSVGDAGSATEVFMRQVIEFLGMSYDDFGDTQRLPFDGQTTAIRNGQLDAGTWVVAPGVSSIQDLASSEPIRILALDDDQLADFQEEYPYYLGTDLEAGTYQGLDEPITLPSTWNSVLVPKDMDEEFVYQVATALHENVDALASGHPAAEALAPENVENALCPLHPGAMRYFEEVGVEVPEDMRPDAAG
ncbi:MAG: TAXI family TRAP transporter solute-binding subunit [Egibacteraceae bacterium]